MGQDYRLQAEPDLTRRFILGSWNKAENPGMKTTVILALLLLPVVAHAGDDHERARRALQAGEVLPLKTILEKANAQFPGDLIEAELEDEHGRMVYELKLISPDGKVMKLHYDARDGSLISAKGKGTRP